MFKLHISGLAMRNAPTDRPTDGRTDGGHSCADWRATESILRLSVNTVNRANGQRLLVMMYSLFDDGWPVSTWLFIACWRRLSISDDHSSLGSTLSFRLAVLLCRPRCCCCSCWMLDAVPRLPWCDAVHDTPFLLHRVPSYRSTTPRFWDFAVFSWRYCIFTQI